MTHRQRTHWLTQKTRPSSCQLKSLMPGSRWHNRLDSYQLLVSLPGRPSGDVTGSYRLEKLNESPAAAFSFDKTDLSLKLSELPSSATPARPIWQYNYGTIVNESIPERESRRSRSCYVHPVWGMHGEILSDDFPKDHYHHHGIFWTWPYVGVGDKTYDTWTSTDIRQRFSKWLRTETGPVAAELGVENDWLVGSQQRGDRTSLVDHLLLGSRRPGNRHYDLHPGGGPTGHTARPSK